MKFEPFDNIFKDATSTFTKVKKEDYKSIGKYPIVDQGQNFIGGYTNDEELVVKENIPVIIFGDHTKIFKYVDFPFTIGADGVKVLSLKNEKDNALFYYYFLKSLKIVDKGYSRHFKYLKEKKLPVIDYLTQLHIASILSKAENLIVQRKESIRLLDEFLKSTFLEMFGDPVRNEKKWNVSTLSSVISGIDSGWSPVCLKESRKNDSEWAILKLGSVTYRKFNPDENKLLDRNTEIKKELIPQKDDLLFSRKNTYELVGATAFVFESYKRLLLPDTIFRINYLKNKVSGLYLWFLFNDLKFRKVIQSLASGTAGSMPNISKEKLSNLKISIPPSGIQTQFAHIVEKTEALKTQYQQSLQELENLYGSLSQKAFKGELILAEQKNPLSLAAEPDAGYKVSRPSSKPPKK